MYFSKLLPYEFKVRTLLFLKSILPKRSRFDIPNQQRRVFIFLAADYGNLGDVAITYAQRRFLREHLASHLIVEIPISMTIDGINAVKKAIKEDDIITTVGGGNMGDLYTQIEFLRQLVVECFPNNKIVSFPQTFDFSDTEVGRKYLNTARIAYARHKDLTFVSREKTSYDLMKKWFFNNNVILSPDIVMSLDRRQESVRIGVVFCLRDDAEKKFKSSDQVMMMDLVKKYFKETSYYDTHINRSNMSGAEGDYELGEIWDAFRKSELVITDRLHGMIFCYITNTPCIVFQNSNHKVKGCYEWIHKKSNIVLIEDFDVEVISKLLEQQFYKQTKYQSIDGEFQPLINCLNT